MIMATMEEPIVVFTSCANSHMFQERRIALTEPYKIGRSVAQSRPAENNGIFDCKVLSRNHALIWYENGKFYLQDTKSSNGTFVNSHRLSKGSEESEPKEIFSGDTIQFGVDVMENSRKVTHSCIIASIQLFHPDGREAISSHATGTNSVMSSAGQSLRAQEFYQLAQYLQDAMHREQMLESKLATLQRLVLSTQEASENGWQALIDEDRLLSRLEVLKNQLSAYAKSQTEDSLRNELAALHEDKFNYETTAKESLRKVLEEKLEAIRKISELEHSLSRVEEECAHLQMACQFAEKELQTLAERYQDQGVEITELVNKLQEAERRYGEREAELEKDNHNLQMRIDELSQTQNNLHSKIEALGADNDFINEQFNNTKVQLEAIKMTPSLTDFTKLTEFTNAAVQVDLINMLDLHNLISNCHDKSDEEDSTDNRLDQEHGEKEWNEKYSGEEKSIGFERLDFAQKQESQIRVHSKGSDVCSSLDASHLTSTPYNAETLITGLQEQLQEETMAVKLHTDEAEQRRGCIESMHEELVYEQQLKLSKTSRTSMEDSEEGRTSRTSNGDINSMQQEIQKESARNRAEFSVLKDECAQLRRRVHDIETEMKMSRHENYQLKEEYRRLQESYEVLERLKTKLQSNESTWQNNMTDAQKEAEQTKLELGRVREELAALIQKCAEREQQIVVLKSELSLRTDGLAEVDEDYSVLSFRCRTLSTLSMIPLIVLILSFILSFLPFLSSVTATAPPSGIPDQAATHDSKT